MAIDAFKLGADSAVLIASLLGKIEAVVQAGGGLSVELVDLVEQCVADAGFKSALSAVIADIKG